MRKSIKISLIPAAALLLGVTALSSTSCGTSNPDYVPDMNVETKGTTIKFWTGFGEKVNNTLQPILDEFTKQTGITVDYEPKGGYEGLQSAVNLAATSGEYPNIVNGYPDHFVGYVTSDIITRLDGYFTADKDRTKDVKIIQHMDYSDFYENYTKENESIEFKSDGTGYILGVPFNKSCELGTYNATFFNLMKMTDSTIKVPATWDEVATEGAKIKKVMADKDIYGKALGFNNVVYADAAAATAAGVKYLDFKSVTVDNFKILSYNSTDNWFITGVRQWGGTYTEVDTATRKGYVAFDNEYTRNFMTKLKSLFDAGYIGIPQTWEETLYCSNPFQINKTVINISSSAGVENSIPSSNAFEVKACPLPYLDQEHAYVISQGTNLALLDKGTDAERVASWKLMIYLSQQVNDEFSIGTGYYPTGKKVTGSDMYQEFINGTGGSAKEKLNREAAVVNTNTYLAAGSFYKMFVDTPFQGSSYIRTTVATIIVTLFYANPAQTNDQIISSILNTLKEYVRK